MNRIEFGLLVASLRDDLRWTQAELAEKAGLPHALVVQVEKGEGKTLLDEDSLLKLADGLLLTSLERREFLMGAAGISTLDMLRPKINARNPRFDAQAFMNEVGAYIAAMPLPVMVIDSFYDLLLANSCAAAFFGTSSAIVSQFGKSVGSFNQIHSFFHRDANFVERCEEQDWDRIATITVREFRRHTLRYRTRSYFSALMKQFLNTRNYPYFERYWRKVVFEIHDDFSAPVVAPAAMNDLTYWRTDSLLALTPHGELYLQQVLPINKPTEKRLREALKASGPGYSFYAPFPDQRKE